MKPNPFSPDDAEDADRAAIIRVAAEWRARQDAGLTPPERAAFDRWLDADPRHAEVAAEMNATWEMLDGVREIPRETLQPAAPRTVVPLPGFRYRVAILAAAAAVVLSGIFWTHRSPPASKWENFHGVVEAAAGEIKRMNLPDGSVIRANAGAAVAVEYSEKVRAVRLVRGEAYFEVAKNKARPFVVTAGGAAVRAVGTAFDVALKASAVEVLVTEGRVTVHRPSAREADALPGSAPGADAPLLEVGQQLALGLEPESPGVVKSVPLPEIEQALAWRARRLDFEAAPLADILAEFNRFNTHQFVIAPSAAELARQRFGGSFRADDPETFLELLKTRANVIVEPGPQQTVLRLAR